jgi:hypothetical protein
MIAGLAEILNAPAEIEHNGRTYQVGDLTLLGRAKFERWLKDRAVNEALRVSEDAPEAARRMLLSEVAQDIASGVYDFGGSACVKAMAQRAGGSYALFLAMEQHDPTVELADAEALYDAKIAERLQLYEKACADPLPGGPAEPPG